MSIINQMLRDLEARSQSHDGAPAAIHAVQQTRRTHTRLWLIALCILVAASGGVYLGAQYGARGTGDSIAQAPINAPQHPARSDTTPTQAKQTTPATIADKTALAPRKGASEHHNAPMETTAAPTGTLRRAHSDATVAGASIKPTGPAPTVTDKPAPAATTHKVAAAPKKHAAAPSSANTATPVPLAGARDPHMSKTRRPRTAAQRASARYTLGMQAVQAGQAGKAQEQFRAALKADPAAYGAREALGALLHRQGRTPEAIRLFNAGIKADPARRDLYARLGARLLVVNGQTLQAIKTLQQHLPTAAEAPEHYAFLAALQERQKDYAAALKNYTLALKTNPDNGRWWAGLAIAYEQTDVTDKALAAYQRASQANGLGVALAAYVDKRIKALKQ